MFFRRTRPAPFSSTEAQAQADRIREAYRALHAEAQRGKAMGLRCTVHWNGLGDPGYSLSDLKNALTITRAESL